MNLKISTKYREQYLGIDLSKGNVNESFDEPLIISYKIKTLIQLSNEN